MTNNTTELHITNATDFNLTTSIPAGITDGGDLNNTIAPDREGYLTDQDESTGMLTYTLIFFGVVILIALVIALGIFLIKKSRLDKLRHHLMPLYNFDPAEEGEDWESELLEEGLDHRLTSKMKKSYCTDEPKLTFNSGI